MTHRSGRCLCGAVRFQLTAEPVATRICWCRDCQTIAANGTVNLLVPAEAVAVEGVLAEHTKTADSGNTVTRQFCPSCGTHVISKSSGRPQFRVVRAGTLDDPSSIQPQANIWAASAPAWACLDPQIERTEHAPLPPGQASSDLPRG